MIDCSNVIVEVHNAMKISISGSVNVDVVCFGPGLANGHGGSCHALHLGFIGVAIVCLKTERHIAQPLSAVCWTFFPGDFFTNSVFLDKFAASVTTVIRQLLLGEEVHLRFVGVLIWSSQLWHFCSTFSHTLLQVVGFTCINPWVLLKCMQPPRDWPMVNWSREQTTSGAKEEIYRRKDSSTNGMIDELDKAKDTLRILWTHGY